MEIVKSVAQSRHNGNCIITMGTFDGVHRGHQSIIEILGETAKQIDGCKTIVTFEPHPQFIIQRDAKHKLKLLTTLDEKIAIFQSLNIDRLIILEFTEAFAQMSSHDFIESILIQKIGFKKIIIGYDHAFGRDRQGNQQVLEALSQRYDFSIAVVPPFAMDGVIISSTLIRRLLREGNIEQATKYLGRDYQLTGTVIHGQGRGRTLKIPTANLEPNSSAKLIPGDGIYAVWARLPDQWCKGVLYIGSRPTFSHHERSIELHVFNFSGNLYNQNVTVHFKAKLRDDYRFADPESLVKQIEEDKKKAFAILTTDHE